MVCQAGIFFDQNCVLLKTSRLTFNLEWRSCIVVAVCLCCAARRARMNCKSKNLCIVVEVASVRAVGGKSLISVVILVENSFRSSNGRSADGFGVARHASWVAGAELLGSLREPHPYPITGSRSFIISPPLFGPQGLKWIY